MDEPITKGPVPRWQKKCLESSSRSSGFLLSSSMNASLNSSKQATSLVGGGQAKTPRKGATLTVEGKKTPSKTPSKTPKKSPGETIFISYSSKTPSGGDRFIPTRSASNFDLGHFKVTQVLEEVSSPTLAEKQRAMSENLHGCDISSTRILAFQKKAPAPPDGYQNALKVVYSQTKTPHSAKANSRYIPQAPDRILDAPDIVDDYCKLINHNNLNLIDWSRSNILAVALGSSVYLWNAASGSIRHLMELEGSDYVCSLGWISEGSDMLAIGTSLGPVQLWDAEQKKRLRVMDGHNVRVGSLSWNSYILSSGCRAGTIVHHDVRQRDHNVSTIAAHSQEVCGLKWSLDGRYLASGGNDNVLNIWPLVQGDSYSQSQALYSFNAHQAAVKALAWCPWQSNLLASGGGTADRHIRFWNCGTGSNISSVDTKSQVCGLLWSTAYKELVSAHGYANNQLIIWKYPSLTKVS
ncbi:hypothetical protein AAG570_011577 [Ranatra chinensis]|uniref:CDC20/Fizzy WD40 domain-containing protein n=1 Tax=Ranatra chinensis TaxID=642074 RepID=A0ABD0YL20_9HEMI